jgi:hypothetical protein
MMTEKVPSKRMYVRSTNSDWPEGAGSNFFRNFALVQRYTPDDLIWLPTTVKASNFVKEYSRPLAVLEGFLMCTRIFSTKENTLNQLNLFRKSKLDFFQVVFHFRAHFQKCKKLCIMPIYCCHLNVNIIRRTVRSIISTEILYTLYLSCIVRHFTHVVLWWTVQILYFFSVVLILLLCCVQEKSASTFSVTHFFAGLETKFY